MGEGLQDAIAKPYNSDPLRIYFGHCHWQASAFQHHHISNLELTHIISFVEKDSITQIDMGFTSCLRVTTCCVLQNSSLLTWRECTSEAMSSRRIRYDKSLISCGVSMAVTCPMCTPLMKTALRPPSLMISTFGPDVLLIRFPNAKSPTVYDRNTKTH